MEYRDNADDVVCLINFIMHSIRKSAASSRSNVFKLYRGEVWILFNGSYYCLYIGNQSFTQSFLLKIIPATSLFQVV